MDFNLNKVALLKDASIVQKIRDLLEKDDVLSVHTLIEEAKAIGYPAALIKSLLFLSKSSQVMPDMMDVDALTAAELPRISPSNYILFRPDLSALGFTPLQAKSHLETYGIQELLKEEESDTPRIRYYFDLNDSRSPRIALAVLGKHTDEIALSCTSGGIPRVAIDIQTMRVCSSHNQALINLEIREIFSFLRLKHGIEYMCFVDSSDTLLPGWDHVIEEIISQNNVSAFITDEYVADKCSPRLIRKLRQYKTTPTPFRVFTRGYASGIVGARISDISDCVFNDTYDSTWCFQVDLLQQLVNIPIEIYPIKIPLLLRDQTQNPAFLEYGDKVLRNYFSTIKESFCKITGQNIQHQLTLCQENSNIAINLDADGQIRLDYASLNGDPPFVSVIIPFRDKPGLLRTCLDSLISHNPLNLFEVILADNGSEEPETIEYLKDLDKDPPCRLKIIRIPGPFNYSRINNIASKHASGNFILLLNNDIEFRQENTIERMLQSFCFKAVGAVSAKLLYPDDSIQHSGIVITGDQVFDTFSPLKGTRYGEYDYYYSFSMLTDEATAGTGACLLIRRDIWEKIGGLDERLAVAYNDIDLCLSIRRLGFSVIIDRSIFLIHDESKSRGSDLLGEAYNRLHRESQYLRMKHAALFEREDPFWPQSLSCSNPRCTPILQRNLYPDIDHISCSVLQAIVGGIAYNSTGHYCVYVNYDANDRIRPDVLEQVKAISSFASIIFVTTSSSRIVNDPLYQQLLSLVNSFIIRKNIGYDFGSWKVGIEFLEANKVNPSKLLLMNDSLYGPLFPMNDVLQKAFSMDTDIVAFTANRVGGIHSQSYFVVYSSRVLQSLIFRVFWKTLTTFPDKFSLVKECEIALSRLLATEGFTSKTLYDTGCFGNQTHITWRELVTEQGFPFVKNELLMSNPTGQEISCLPEILQLNESLYRQMIDFWNDTESVPSFI